VICAVPCWLQAELPDLLEALDGVSTASVPDGLLRDMEDVNGKGGAVHLREVRPQFRVPSQFNLWVTRPSCP
jgi:hypothetical protein